MKNTLMINLIHADARAINLFRVDLYDVRQRHYDNSLVALKTDKHTVRRFSEVINLNPAVV